MFKNSSARDFFFPKNLMCNFGFAILANLFLLFFEALIQINTNRYKKNEYKE
jgi:hypothetical protein